MCFLRSLRRIEVYTHSGQLKCPVTGSGGIRVLRMAVGSSDCAVSPPLDWLCRWLMLRPPSPPPPPEAAAPTAPPDPVVDELLLRLPGLPELLLLELLALEAESLPAGDGCCCCCCGGGDGEDEDEEDDGGRCGSCGGGCCG